MKNPGSLLNFQYFYKSPMQGTTRRLWSYLHWGRNQVLDEISVLVIVTNKFSMLELSRLDGKIDQNTAIFGYDD